MRKLLLLLVALVPALVLAASATGGRSAPTTASTIPGCARGSLHLVTANTLTVATDNPAYPPWFGGDQKSPWKVSDPRSGKGYESAFAYAVARQLGFTRDQVKWVYAPFLKATAPGRKSFDFDVNQISYSAARAKAATFSSSYYDVRQSVVVRKGTPIANVRSMAGLKKYKLGAQIGTTSYQYIQNRIKPTRQASAFPQNIGAITALKNGQIDGLVVDLPTAFIVTAVQVAEREGARAAASRARRRALRGAVPEGQSARRLRQQGDRPPEDERHAEDARAGLAAQGDRRAEPHVAPWTSAARGSSSCAAAAPDGPPLSQSSRRSSSSRSSRS